MEDGSGRLAGGKQLSAPEEQDKRILGLNRQDAILRILLFAVAWVLLFFCSRNSPAFPYQDWIDPNIYMNVGRAMRDGQVLYRDIFDHKGPLLHLIFMGLSAIPAFRFTMTGLYLLECLSLSITLHFLYKTARRYITPVLSAIAGLLFLFLLLNSFTFGQGGGSVEELMLPLVSAAVYEMVICLGPRKEEEKEGMPRQSRLLPLKRWFRTRAEDVNTERQPAFILLGFSCGAALSTKLNLAAFFVAVIAFLLLPGVLRKDFKWMGRALFKTAGGFFAALLPSILYMAITGSFGDCFDAYIVFNLVYAGQSGNTSGEMTFFEAAGKALFLNLLSTGFLVSGAAFAVFRRGKRITLFRVAVVAVFTVLFIVTYIVNRSYPYMFIPLIPFAFLGAVISMSEISGILQRFFASRQMKLHLSAGILAAVLPLILLLIVVSNGSWSKSVYFRGEITGAERIAQRILEDTAEDKEKPEILCFYSGDIGVYQMTDSVPHLRYFYAPMIDVTVYPEVMREQIRYVEEGLADYVIFIWADENYVYDLTSLNSDYQVVMREKQNVDGNIDYITLFARQTESG